MCRFACFLVCFGTDFGHALGTEYTDGLRRGSQSGAASCTFESLASCTTVVEHSSYREAGCVQRFRRLETLSDSYCGNRKVRLQRLRMVHPYPTPKLGISARHAVSNLSGCGVGAPNPIANPMMSKPPRKKLWGWGPAKKEPLLTLQSDGFVRFEQFWGAVLSRT